MDTRKETVRKSIHFDSPEYLPLLYHGTERIEKSDAVMLPVEEMFGGEDGLWSEWGFRWAENNKSFKLGALKYFAVPDWNDLDGYVPPDTARSGRFDACKAVMRRYPDRYYIADFILSGFTIMAFMRGFENFLTDLYLERENVERLADIVFGTEEKLIKECAAQGFDAVCFADDWGTQDSLIISRNMITEIFIPRYRRQTDLAHSLGLDVIMHSCGYIIDIIGDLIEAGFDVINPGQPVLNGVERLGERFAGRVCFGCPVGYQTTAITGTPDDIINEVRNNVARLSVPEGGFIGFVSVYKTLRALGSSEENAQAVERAFEACCGKIK